MVVAALTQPIERRQVAAAAAAAYALVAFGSATLAGSFWVTLLVPGALLLTGYWLSGLMFHSPQPWLERWLLATDKAVGADRWMARTPRAVAEILEASYAADYLVVGGGAIFAATAGVDAAASYWSLVLTSELASFAPLPWLRSRPPRALEAAPANPLFFGRLNASILNHASVQANTLPSGHVSGAVAAALGVMPVDATAGVVLMGVAGLIAVAAIAGRYHYVADCVAGVAVSLLVWSAMS